MKVLIWLGVLFYSAIIILLGITLIAVSLRLLPAADISNLIYQLQSSLNLRFAVGLIGILLILITFSFARVMLRRFQKDKNIPFTTSSGEVTVALSAVEDLIKRLSGAVPEVKELRPDVISTKKGIVVDLRVTLKSEANIPELTNRLQEVARARIQEILGVEEQIVVNVHVAKIIAAEEKERGKKGSDKKGSDKEEPNVPFGGYRRV
ncbi:MAG: alkaline shock response membrane anchor protein AmaP [Candidatus Omnitrophota bacterium]|nr:MAG: alkaline shock response membrane anchor protein AmaP [Candidatus Omnitrophota bacterium]